MLHGRLPGPGSGGGPELVDVVARAGLVGRGGASFPTARKLASVAAARRTPVVVANGAEGEPASTKDRLLMEALPQLVLDGAVLAAQAVGAPEALICVKASDTDAIESLVSAISERVSARHDPVEFRIVHVPNHYLAGEENALVHYLNNGVVKPVFVPPRVFERGVDRRPTLVQNVETLAHLALIARYGARWYRELGTDAEPGSTLVTLSGAAANPGVYEVARGTPLSELLGAAGGTTMPISAVLVGGYFGSWIDADTSRTARLEDAELAAHDAALGCGVLFALPASACGPAEVTRVARYLASQSSGQCGPCLYGLDAIAAGLEGVIAGRAAADTWATMGRRLRQVNGRGACHHPNGTVRFVASALRVFAREWEEHAARGPCDACAQSRLLPVPTQLRAAA